LWCIIIFCDMLRGVTWVLIKCTFFDLITLKNKNRSPNINKYLANNVYTHLLTNKKKVPHSTCETGQFILEYHILYHSVRYTNISHDINYMIFYESGILLLTKSCPLLPVSYLFNSNYCIYIKIINYWCVHLDAIIPFGVSQTQ
jgi:hypothetical protein